MASRVRSQETDYQCRKCEKYFSQKSSLTRHAKRCFLDLPPPSRQKSCQGCAFAKVRCNLRRPTCSRCSARGFECVFPTSNAMTPPDTDSASDSDLMGNNQPLPDSMNGYVGPQADDLANNSYYAAIFPEGALPAIRDHVLVGGYAAPTPQSDMALQTVAQVVRVQRSWVGMMARKEHLPPIIHAQQLAHGIPLEIMSSYLVAKAWDVASPEKMAYIDQIVDREIDSLHSRYAESVEERSLLCDLQAMLFLAIIALFPKGGSRRDHAAEQAIFIKMQDIAYRVAQTGLCLEAESKGDVPAWDSWYLAQAKRRAIIAVYQMGWAWTVRNNYTGFHCHELDFMEAPAPKSLWEADSEEKFRKAYATWKGKWGEETPLLIGELLSIPHGMADLDRRVELWLEDADEFGMYMMGLAGADGDN